VKTSPSDPAQARKADFNGVCGDDIVCSRAGGISICGPHQRSEIRLFRPLFGDFAAK
jgi:hypothetical protein